VTGNYDRVELKPIKVVLAFYVIDFADSFADRTDILTSDGLYCIIAKLAIG
jgi:hypothetical protein